MVWQWRGVIAGLLQAFPRHSVVVHGAGAALRRLGASERVIQYEGKSIKEFFEEVSAADLVIAPDSFALHLASLYDVPAVGYFGPAYPHRSRPTGPGSRSLFRQLECPPCLQRRGSRPCANGLTQCISLAQRTPANFVRSAEATLACRQP